METRFINSKQPARYFAEIVLTAVYDAFTIDVIARIDVIGHGYIHVRLYWAIHINII